MTFDEKGLDRLMPRHDLPQALTIRWDTARKRGRPGRDVGWEAVIRDLSLNGALIEVDGDRTNAVGEHVRIRLGGLEGTVEVRHRAEATEGHGQLYGVSFVDTAQLQGQFEILIGYLRNDGRIRNLWQHAD